MNDPKEQFSSIYDQYIEKIYRFVYLKVSSQEIAEDLTSKVFLKGWEAYKRNQEIKNPGAFLYRIARNAVIDHYRERGRAKTVSMDNIPEIADFAADPHEKALLNADITSITSAILKLQDDYQDVLIWYYLEDMSAEQIAALLDKPAGTVRVMIHRGLQALKDELREQS
jgi:RNA polymerase sigma-70 factor (ECF subfamily)